MATTNKQLVVLLTVAVYYALGGSFDVCSDVQYLELFQNGMIHCSFEEDYIEIQWYNSTDVGTAPIITYMRSQKSGHGYISGDYDIWPNGSLIIKNVTLKHERTFSVILTASESEPDVRYTIRVKTVVPPTRPYPVIDQCQNQSTVCFAVFKTQSSLNCFVNNARPQASLAWSQRNAYHDNHLISELTVIPKNEETFTSLTTVKLSNTLPLLSVFACNIIEQEWLLEDDEALIVLESIDIDKTTPKPIRYNIEVHSAMTLPCTGFKGNILVWKRFFGITNFTEIILVSVKNWKNDFTKTYDEDFNVASDGSLLLKATDWHHSGKYTCLVTDYSTTNIHIIDVVIFVNPSPPYLMVEGCNHQRICALNVQREGNLTCSVYGIRPEVELEWRTYIQGTAVSFNGQSVKSKSNGGGFDISLTTNFKVESTLEKSITLQCLVVGTNSDAFHLSIKVDILPLSDHSLLGSLKAVWITTGLVTTGLFISVLLVILCKVTRKPSERNKSEKVEAEETIPMIEPERVKYTPTFEKDSVNEETEETNLMLEPKTGTRPSICRRDSDKEERKVVLVLELCIRN